jgi:hypothetical protein
MTRIIKAEVEAEYPAISWGAVIAGWLFAFGLAVLLYLFGLATGLTTMAVRDQIFSGALVATGFWMMLSWVMATYAGGWLAGRLSPQTDAGTGMAHGALVWALSGVMTLLFTAFASATAITTGAQLGQTAAEVGQAAAQAGARIDAEGRDINAVVDQANAEANRLAAEAQSAGAAEDAGDVTSAALWGMFLTSLLGLMAGAFGGSAGVKGARRIRALETMIHEEHHETYQQHYPGRPAKSA